MKLVYEKTGEEVKIGDIVLIDMDHSVQGGPRIEQQIKFFREPHKPSSSGKVSLSIPGNFGEQEYYVGIIGAKWIDREDQHNGND